MALAVLSIDLEAKLANLEQGMNRAAQLTKNSTQQMQRSLDSLKAAGAALGPLLGSAFAGFNTIALVRSTVDGIDALNDLKDATGASIENLSALEDVALRGGTSFDGMSTALLKFNKVLNEATPGSETAKILKSIGVEAEALKKLDPAEALRQTAVALGRYANDGEKARRVQSLLGKSTQELAKFLKDLAESGGLVATVTTKQADEAKKFNDQLDALSKSSVDAARTLSGPLIAAINKTIEKFAEGSKASEGFLGTTQALLGTLQKEQLKLLGYSPTESNEIEKTTKQIKVLNDLLADENVATERKVLMREKLATLQAKINGAFKFEDARAGAGRGFVNPERVRPSVPDIPDKPSKALGEKASEYEKMIKRLEEMQISLLDYTEVERVELDLSIGKYGQLDAAQKQLLLNLAKGVDLTKDAAPFVGPQIDTGELRKRNDAQKELNSLLDSLPTTKLEELQSLQSALQVSFNEGSIGGAKFAEALAALGAKYDELSPKAKGAIDEMQKFSEQFAASASQTLGDNVFDVLNGNFDNIEKAWGNMLKRMAAQAIAQGLTKLILGAFGGTSTGYGSGGGGGLAFAAMGKAFDRSGMQTFARGDIFDSPTMFAYGGSNLGIMGEAGPEAIMPLKRGRDGKLGVAGSGGGRSIVVNNYGDTVVGDGVSRGEVEAAVRAGQAQTESRIRRLSRDGLL
jgi:hypothetical protein